MYNKPLIKKRFNLKISRYLIMIEKRLMTFWFNSWYKILSRSLEHFYFQYANTPKPKVYIKKVKYNDDNLIIVETFDKNRLSESKKLRCSLLINKNYIKMIRLFFDIWTRSKYNQIDLNTTKTQRIFNLVKRNQLNKESEGISKVIIKRIKQKFFVNSVIMLSKVESLSLKRLVIHYFKKWTIKTIVLDERVRNVKIRFSFAKKMMSNLFKNFDSLFILNYFIKWRNWSKKHKQLNTIIQVLTKTIRRYLLLKIGNLKLLRETVNILCRLKENLQKSKIRNQTIRSYYTWKNINTYKKMFLNLKHKILFKLIRRFCLQDIKFIFSNWKNKPISRERKLYINELINQIKHFIINAIRRYCLSTFFERINIAHKINRFKEVIEEFYIKFTNNNLIYYLKRLSNLNKRSRILMRIFVKSNSNRIQKNMKIKFSLLRNLNKIYIVVNLIEKALNQSTVRSSLKMIIKIYHFPSIICNIKIIFLDYYIKNFKNTLKNLLFSLKLTYNSGKLIKQLRSKVLKKIFKTSILNQNQINLREIVSLWKKFTNHHFTLNKAKFNLENTIIFICKLEKFMAKSIVRKVFIKLREGRILRNSINDFKEILINFYIKSIKNQIVNNLKIPSVVSYPSKLIKLMQLKFLVKNLILSQKRGNQVLLNRNISKWRLFKSPYINLENREDTVQNSVYRITRIIVKSIRKKILRSLFDLFLIPQFLYNFQENIIDFYSKSFKSQIINILKSSLVTITLLKFKKRARSNLLSDRLKLLNINETIRNFKMIFTIWKETSLHQMNFNKKKDKINLSINLLEKSIILSKRRDIMRTLFKLYILPHFFSVLKEIFLKFYIKLYKNQIKNILQWNYLIYNSRKSLSDARSKFLKRIKYFEFRKNVLNCLKIRFLQWKHIFDHWTFNNKVVDKNKCSIKFIEKIIIKSNRISTFGKLVRSIHLPHIISNFREILIDFYIKSIKCNVYESLKYSSASYNSSKFMKIYKDLLLSKFIRNFNNKENQLNVKKRFKLWIQIHRRDIALNSKLCNVIKLVNLIDCLKSKKDKTTSFRKLLNSYHLPYLISETSNKFLDFYVTSFKNQIVKCLKIHSSQYNSSKLIKILRSKHLRKRVLTFNKKFSLIKIFYLWKDILNQKISNNIEKINNSIHRLRNVIIMSNRRLFIKFYKERYLLPHIINYCRIIYIDFYTKYYKNQLVSCLKTHVFPYNSNKVLKTYRSKFLTRLFKFFRSKEKHINLTIKFCLWKEIIHQQIDSENRKLNFLLVKQIDAKMNKFLKINFFRNLTKCYHFPQILLKLKKNFTDFYVKSFKIQIMNIFKNLLTTFSSRRLINLLKLKLLSNFLKSIIIKENHLNLQKKFSFWIQISKVFESKSIPEKFNILIYLLEHFLNKSNLRNTLNKLKECFHTPYIISHFVDTFNDFYSKSFKNQVLNILKDVSSQYNSNKLIKYISSKLFKKRIETFNTKVCLNILGKRLKLWKEISIERKLSVNMSQLINAKLLKNHISFLLNKIKKLYIIKKCQSLINKIFLKSQIFYMCQSFIKWRSISSYLTNKQLRIINILTDINKIQYHNIILNKYFNLYIYQMRYLMKHKYKLISRVYKLFNHR